MTFDLDIGSATVSRLLAAIASDQPAPGAGAAGAVALALGLACARKAVRISGRHHPTSALLPAVDDRLAALTDEAMERGQQDARRFTALVKAMQLPDVDAGQTAARDTTMADAEAAVRSNTVR
ncbi:cyclodeaminase/cyclohydrolase family protein [Sphingomonas profundi]|uniref:cyclodeaminase/cyclohydrolase family protein n=1 Tax=Alterirhizorhabdus profundi TaxID=2681549 RepID=UPI0012E7A54B|nr:cyclodeaminase/cyclohydrolase family protein [Sphingomonas profundi]